MDHYGLCEYKLSDIIYRTYAVNTSKKKDTRDFVGWTHTGIQIENQGHDRVVHLPDSGC